MNNNGMQTLNMEDGWEGIINENAKQKASARERVAARKRERRIRKLLLSVCVLSGTGIALVILGAAGAIAGWLTTIVANLCLLAAFFQFGRYIEAKKK